ncbi:MAG: TIGR02281 family clan AA aspartic protease [Gammaproteobacteria bacterium]|nr:TIGR02281 family clan AA aspartic protease [Gammaproteobacteria bacterium]
MNNDKEAQETRQVGRHMMLLAWIIALALLAYFFSGVLDRQHNPNQRVQSSVNEQGRHEVILTRNRQGHYVSNGFINNQPVVFLLDTGATVVSVPEGTARRLGLKAGATSYANTANGTITTYATRLDSIGIGSIQLNNVAAHINPYMSGEEILLGMSFLKKLELIQRGNTLTLRQPQ